MSTAADVDVEQYEEPEQEAIRNRLSLRPVAYQDSDSRLRGGHPDQRPCPPW